MTALFLQWLHPGNGIIGVSATRRFYAMPLSPPLPPFRPEAM